MRSTFNLKEPNKDKESLILFSAYFKNEGRKFIYSTGELIHPKEWDFENKQPNNLKGRTEQAANHRTIKRQLDRYSNFFSDTINGFKLTQREITINDVKEEFDKEFKRTSAISKSLFSVYDLFLEMKRTDYTDASNSEQPLKDMATIKSY